LYLRNPNIKWINIFIAFYDLLLNSIKCWTRNYLFYFICQYFIGTLFKSRWCRKWLCSF